jgi:hypothetical protein
MPTYFLFEKKKVGKEKPDGGLEGI